MILEDIFKIGLFSYKTLPGLLALMAHGRLKTYSKYFFLTWPFQWNIMDSYCWTGHFDILFDVISNILETINHIMWWIFNNDIRWLAMYITWESWLYNNRNIIYCKIIYDVLIWTNFPCIRSAAFLCYFLVKNRTLRCFMHLLEKHIMINNMLIRVF